MASTKENPEGRETPVRTDTTTGEPIADDAAREETPLEREQEDAFAYTRVEDDGVHRGVTGPPKGSNDHADDGNDPERPNISPLGRDVKYPHQLGITDPGHQTTIEDAEAKRDGESGTKRVDVKSDRGEARTSATPTPGTKR